MTVFLEDLETEEAGKCLLMRFHADSCADTVTTLAEREKTKWSICIFGGNAMLEDESMPFELEGDEEFDSIMDALIVSQERDGESLLDKRSGRIIADRFTTEERRIVGEMADALAVVLEQGKSKVKARAWTIR